MCVYVWKKDKGEKRVRERRRYHSFCECVCVFRCFSSCGNGGLSVLVCECVCLCVCVCEGVWVGLSFCLCVPLCLYETLLGSGFVHGGIGGETSRTAHTRFPQLSVRWWARPRLLLEDIFFAFLFLWLEWGWGFQSRLHLCGTDKGPFRALQFSKRRPP